MGPDVSGAVTITAVGAGYTSTGQASAYDYTGVTPVDERGYLLHVGVGTGTGNDALAPTITSDTGLDFVLVASEEDSSFPDRITALYKASKPSGLTTGKVTLTHPTSGHVYSYALAQLYEIVGATPGTDGADLIRSVSAVPQVTAQDSANVVVASAAISLPAAPEAGTNNVVAVFAGTHKVVNLRIDPVDTGWAKLSELDVAAGKNMTIAGWWKDDLDQSTTVEVRLDGDDLTSDTTKLQTIMVEIVAAASGSGTTDTKPTFARKWGSGYTRTVDGTSDTFPSTTTVTGKAYLLALHHAVASGNVPAAPSSVDFGAGLTLTEVFSQEHSSSSWARALRYYTGVCTAGATVAAPSATWASQSQAQVMAELVEVTDGDITSSGANLIAAYTHEEYSHTDTAATTQRVERATPFESGAPNASLAFIAKHLVGTYIPYSSPVWTEISDLSSSDVPATLAAYTFDGAPSPLEFVAVSKAVDGTTNQSSFWMATWFEVRGATTSAPVDQELGDEPVSWTDEDTLGAEVNYTEAWELLVEELTVDRTEPPPTGGGGSDPGPAGPSGVLGEGATSVSLDVSIRVRDSSLRLTDEVAKWDTLEVVMRWQDTSSWILELPSDTTAARHIIAPGAGVMILRNGLTLISGPVVGWEMRLEVDNGNPRFVTMVHGYDDTWALTRRRVSPEPQTFEPPYDDNEADIRTGPAETLMLGYVDDNMGPSAIPGRQWPYLTIATDQVRGGPDGPDGVMPQGRGRWQSVFELVQQLAIQTGLGFRIVQVPDPSDPTLWTLEFQVLSSTDRSGSAIFSYDLGNLAGYSWGWEQPEATYLYVAGQGEGAAREVIERSNDGDMETWGRHEDFRDRRDVELGDVAGLESAAQQALAEVQAHPSLALAVVDGMEGTRYGLDYLVGDEVSVLLPDVSPADPAPVTYGAAGPTYGSIFAGRTYGSFGGSMLDPQGARITDVVREITLRYQPSDDGLAESIDPTIGADQAGTTSALRDFHRRLSLQERTR